MLRDGTRQDSGRKTNRRGAEPAELEHAALAALCPMDGEPCNTSEKQSGFAQRIKIREHFFCCWKAFHNQNLKLCCLLSSQSCPRGAAAEPSPHIHTPGAIPRCTVQSKEHLQAQGMAAPHLFSTSPVALRHWEAWEQGDGGTWVMRVALGHRTAPQPGFAQLLLAGSRQAAALQPRRWAPVVFFALGIWVAPLVTYPIHLLWWWHKADLLSKGGLRAGF